MLNQLLSQAEKNAQVSGNVVEYEINELAHSLTIGEIEKLAKNIGNRRMIIQSKNYRLADRGERGTRNHLGQIRMMVAGQIDGLRINKLMELQRKGN